MKVGFSRVCITPPLGCELAGYYRSRKAKGVLDDLFVNAVAYDDGEKKALTISVDHLHLYTKEVTAFRKMISERCGLPVEAVFIACTHIHTGPSVGEEIAGVSGDAIYDEYIGIKICDAARMALDDAEEARLSYAVGEAKNISFVRRFRMKDGSVRTNPGIGNPDIDHPLGEPHESVYLLKAERETKDDIYVVSFGVHPDVISGEYISADWPGFVRTTVEKALDGVKCAFFTGFEGDVNHFDTSPIKGDWDIRTGYEHSKHMGRCIAGAVLQICGKTTPVEGDKVGFGNAIARVESFMENDKLDDAKRIVELHKAGRDDEIPGEGMEHTTIVAEAVRRVKLENGPEYYDFTMSAVSVGNVAFGGLPGEPFTEIGNRIRANSKFAMTILCCCTNGSPTYFPTSSAYDEGGYEARTSYLKRGGDDILVEGLSDLINSL